jgi:hypothetical protein
MSARHESDTGERMLDPEYTAVRRHDLVQTAASPFTPQALEDGRLMAAHADSADGPVDAILAALEPQVTAALEADRGVGTAAYQWTEAGHSGPRSGSDAG